jgi:hypothetical protein
VTQLNQLVIALQAGGSAGVARVFAAYGEVDTTTPTVDAAQPPRPATGPASESGNVHSPVSVVTPNVTVTANQPTVPIELSCAAGAVGGCHGVLVLRVLGHATSATAAASNRSQPQAVAARCARGCRILGRQSFNIAAGRHQRVPVHLAHSARHLLHSHHRVSAQAVAITTDSTGNTQITKSALTVSQGTGGGKPLGPAPGPSVTQPTSNSLP